MHCNDLNGLAFVVIKALGFVYYEVLNAFWYVDVFIYIYIESPSIFSPYDCFGGYEVSEQLHNNERQIVRSIGEFMQLSSCKYH